MCRLSGNVSNLTFIDFPFSPGNLLEDLDRRFDAEKEALLRRMREGNDRDAQEKERQKELTRLRLEARKAGREANFDSAALMLGMLS